MEINLLKEEIVRNRFYMNFNYQRNNYQLKNRTIIIKAVNIGEGELFDVNVYSSNGIIKALDTKDVDAVIDFFEKNEISYKKINFE